MLQRYLIDGKLVRNWHVPVEKTSCQHKAIKVTGSHFACVYLRLKYPIRSGEVHLFPTAFMCCWLGLRCPAPLHPLLSLKKWKTVWLLWKSNYKNKYVYFQFISPPIPACSPQALASLLAATASHYLNSEFLSGFSQFSHTFNLWQNEWWLLSIKKKKPLTGLQRTPVD